MDATTKYRNAAASMLRLVPVVARQECFALYGGTALNFFLQDMPRYSVDLDLHYLPPTVVGAASQAIQAALSGMAADIEASIPGAVVRKTHRDTKLRVKMDMDTIKIEAGPFRSGVLYPPQTLALCQKAQREFQCPPHSIQVLDSRQIFAGKICAALGRQYPRDLFDAGKMLEAGDVNTSVTKALMLELLSSETGIAGTICQPLIDHSDAISRHFQGLTQERFSYDDHKAAWARLRRTVMQCLTSAD